MSPSGLMVPLARKFAEISPGKYSVARVFRNNAFRTRRFRNSALSNTAFAARELVRRSQPERNRAAVAQVNLHRNVRRSEEFTVDPLSSLNISMEIDLGDGRPVSFRL